jgi:DNA-binding HxlR family transcriptional regulator
MSAGRQPGDATLALLATDGMLAILAKLRHGPVRAREIEATVPGTARRTALRRLQALATHGYASARDEDDRGGPTEVSRESLSGSSSRGRRESSSTPASVGPQGPARGPYMLTELGRGCLSEVVEAAAHCERKWCPPPSAPQPGEAGLWTIELVADLPARAIVRALADAPLRQGELLAHLPQFARSTLLGRLKMLSSCGLLDREAHPPRGVRYALTEGARHLAVVALRAAACEGQAAAGARERQATDARERQAAGSREGKMTVADERQAAAALENHPTAGADLPGLLHVLAPLARVDREIAGACRCRLDSPGAGVEPRGDTYLTARAGRIAALGAAPTIAPDTDCVAGPEAWGEALLSGDPSPIRVIGGDRTLFEAIFAGLSAALLA